VTDAEDETWPDDAPFVCPGCFAVGGEPCAPDCIDAAIEAERQDRYDYDEHYPYDRDPSDDEDVEPVPESCRTPPLQEAAAELALCQKRLERSVSRLVGALTPTERQRLLLVDRLVRVDAVGPRPAPSPAELLFGRESARKLVALRTLSRQNLGTIVDMAAWLDAQPIAEGGYSCRWCRELVETEDDERHHDFCEPHGVFEEHVLEPNVPSNYVHRLPNAAQDRFAERTEWQDEVLCSPCNTWHPVTLRREGATTLTATTLQCPCGHNLRLVYSWPRRALVQLDVYRRGQALALVRK